MRVRGRLNKHVYLGKKLRRNVRTLCSKISSSRTPLTARIHCSPVGSFFPDNFPLNTHVHTIGNWTTLDWQISYWFGQSAEISPETPRPGYNKEGGRILGEQAIAPKAEGSRWSWRNWLADTTITFGINNIFDTRPPLSVDNTISNFDNASGANFIQRYFWFSIDKKF